jgi:hypothetical protein
MPDIFSAKNKDETLEPGVIVEPSTEQAFEPAEVVEPRIRRHVDEYSQTMKAEAPSRSVFDAYAAKPAHTRFESQHTEERVILVLRQHPITQVQWVVVALGLALLPFFFPFWRVFEFLPSRFEIAALALWYLLVMGFSLQAFLSWFYNTYIITDERVIDVDFQSLIFKNISSAKIDNIEDVTATTGGALRSVFDYGTVKVQTAATEKEFEFANVPHPSKVTALVNELLLEEEREKVEGRVN